MRPILLRSMPILVVCVIVASFFSLVTPHSLAETIEERKARLSADLADIEKQILIQQGLVEAKQSERQSLERDIAILDAKIKKAQLGLKARTIEIENLGSQIGGKQVVINVLTERLERQKQSLAQVVRRTNEIDDYSLVEVVLANTNFSKFFEDLDSFNEIKSSLRSAYDELQGTKTDTEEQKTLLEDRKENEMRLKKLQEVEKKEIETRSAERAKILKVTKGEESAYQTLLKQQQKTAAQIRAQLFELRGSTAIPFPEALRLARFAGAKTGVRAALIMGILTQETRLGENLGVVGRWATDMHPTRDQPVFKVIMATVGLDPNSVPVSAAAGLSTYGGAMGPSQFIPSTWATYGGYVKDGAGNWAYIQSKDIIRQLVLKSSPSNPYENQDAFMATALLMSDNGASAQTYAAERLAAIRYFAGWGGANNPVYGVYGDQVMGHTATIEQEIKILEGG